ncbi:MAG: glutamate-1-semialdehyde 2,1-aminomutase [Chloroherpetonaceae bacterium]|nr:glutamate-1-semialdehyde 2,1-aminomutase [Chthonomonadaceae bacterium]MDW8206197.1 glutamate-1-semialdehyde 2,1-aminomutase [Chloroherpetonaceae bacterium]
MHLERSRTLLQEALEVIPGGVNSPVRAFRAVGGTPPFIERGQGAYLYDVDGNRYLDCIGSWGPLIFGHAHPRVLAAIRDQLEHGTTFGAPTVLEVRLAQEIVEAVPSIEKVRLVSSGTEATMSAIRVARGFTGRNRIVKFEGNYHGHADFLLAKAGSGVATLGLPECAGVPPNVTADTLTLPYNDTKAVRELFAAEGDTIACVILEPVVGNMGCVPPQPGFLETLREVTARHGSVLIFDEVMTGFRLAYGGAQERFGVTPDMTALGKILGGGLPLGAYGGRAEIMDTVAPAGPVYQAGTLSGNPVAVTAGRTLLGLLRENRATVYARLESMGRQIAEGLYAAAAQAGVPVTVNQVGSMVTVFFTEHGPVTDYASARTSSTAQFARWFHAMLEQGIYWPPSQFEAAFLSAVMTDADVEHLLAAAHTAFARCAEERATS